MRTLLSVSPTGQASGAEKVLLRALAAAREAGWQVCCMSPPGPLVDRLEEAGVSYRRIPDLKLPGGPAPLAAAALALRTLAAAPALRRAARPADLVLVNGFFALPALRLARLRKPVAWLVHDVVHRGSWLRLLDLTASAITTAVAVSEAVAVPLRRFGMDVRVVRNGTQWPVEPLSGRPAGPFVVGCAAMLTSWKGQDVLLDAVAQTRRTDVVVELAGGHFPKDGPYVRRLRERADRSDLRGRVRFLGDLSDPLARMRTWTVGVLPSVDPEAGPLFPLEAMSIGLPLVGTDIGGTSEVVAGAGLLVPPRNPPALAGAIEKLLDDEELWARCHQAGPAEIGAGLTLDSQMEKLLGILDSLAPGDC